MARGGIPCGALLLESERDGFGHASLRPAMEDRTRPGLSRRSRSKHRLAGPLDKVQFDVLQAKNTLRYIEIL
jgi:hypothetical protein